MRNSQDIQDLVVKLGPTVLHEPISTWAENRRGTTRKYYYARANGKKICLGPPHIHREFLALVRQRRINAFGSPYSVKELVRQAEAEGRKNNFSRTANRLLAPVGKRICGNKIREIRSDNPENYWRAEFRNFSRPLLEQRLWPGFSEDDWVALRRLLLRTMKQRAHDGQPFYEPHPLQE